MGAAPEGEGVALGGELSEDEEVERENASNWLPSKWLDGGANSSTCGICSIFVQTRGSLDCCNHLFCFNCITEWFTVSNLCPLCKSRSRFITPQMLCSETRCWVTLESGSGSAKRDEAPSDEDGHPVSFPPYFIDEEAVLCLDGDACLIRAELVELGEGSAASDTSVACDLCDCWYHGGCVNFKPDQSSFHCPRCLASKEKEEVSGVAAGLSDIVSFEGNVSAVTSLPVGNRSAYGWQTMFGNASLALEGPEEGESHVSISLCRVPDMQHAIIQASPLDAEREIMWSPIRESSVVPSYGATWPLLSGPAMKSQQVTKDPYSCNREPARNVPYFQEELWSPTREPARSISQVQEEMWSPTREPVKPFSSVGAWANPSVTLANSYRAASTQRLESRATLTTAGSHAVVPPRPELQISSTRVQHFPAAVPKSVSVNDASTRVPPFDTSGSIIQPLGLVKGELSIDVDRLQVAVEQLRKGKRKVLQEDEKNVEYKDLPELPRKLLRKSTKKADAFEENSLGAEKDIVKTVTPDVRSGEHIDTQILKPIKTTKIDPIGKAATAAKRGLTVKTNLASKTDLTATIDLAVSTSLSAKTTLQSKTDLATKTDVPVGTDLAVKSDLIESSDASPTKDLALQTDPAAKTDLAAGADPAANAVVKIEVEAETEGMKVDVAVKTDLVVETSSSLQRESNVKLELMGVCSKKYQDSSTEKDFTAEKVDTPRVELCPEVDVMDIVSDTGGFAVKEATDMSGLQKGVRTRIIMHREPDVNDSERPSLVERIRQQMRDTAGYGAGEDLGKVEVSDDRFIAAFRAAQTRSLEKSKEVKSVPSRQQNSGRLWKVLDKRYNGRGARDNLTRKLYAGGTGRRCWDRDWDIAFWKERDPHQRRDRKESEEGSEKFLKQGIAADKEAEPEDMEFFNRLYVADTSLFPRTEDVKPLAAHATYGEDTVDYERERSRNGKGLELHPNEVSLIQGFKDSSQASQAQAVQNLSGYKSCANKVSSVPFLQKGVQPPSSGLTKKSSAPSSSPKEASTIASTSSVSANAKLLKSRVASSTAQIKEPQGTVVSEAKKDKRQWALEILARKEGKSSSSTASAKASGSVTKDNPFHHLLQLPVEMRPLIFGDSRRSKVPPAVRQVQLNRLVEQELRRAKLAVIQDGPDCAEAISRAVSREEELYKTSNSKGVYVNRCVRALANTDYEVKSVEHSQQEVHENSQCKSEETSRLEEDDAVRKAFEETGLTDSPIADHLDELNGDNSNLAATETKIPDVNVDSRHGGPAENNWVENVLEADNADLDIYGDFEFNSDDDLDSTSLKERAQNSKGTAVYLQSSNSKANPMMVVLTTGSCQSEAYSETAEAEVLTKKQASKKRVEGSQGESNCSEVGGSDTILPAVEGEACGIKVEPNLEDADDMYDNLELNLDPVLSSEVMAHFRSEPCASLFPDLEPTTGGDGRTPREVHIPNVDSNSIESENISRGDPAPTENINEDDSLKFADLDRRIENIRRQKAVNGDPHRARKSKGRAHGDAKRTSETSVQMQVEIYVNQHLKPLYRSQVISAEQFKWTVSKTAAKVMEHHGSAASADFLITEGTKVKKLADQYLQAFSHRKA